MFKTESVYEDWHGITYGDKVTIDGIEYSGDQNINQIVPKNFTVYFSSDEYVVDKGFIFVWTCSDFEFFWSEWTQE